MQIKNIPESFEPYKVVFRNTCAIVIANSPILAMDFARLFLSPIIGLRERPLVEVATKRDIDWAYEVGQRIYVLGETPCEKQSPRPQLPATPRALH